MGNRVVSITTRFRGEAKAANRALRDVEGLDDCTEKANAVEKSKRAKEQHDGALRSQKELFLVVFQRFVMALSQHLTACEAEGTEPNSMWFACTLARLRQIGR